MGKNIRCFLENIFEYYLLNIIVKLLVIWILLWILPWNTATSKSYIRKKLTGGARKYFLTKLLSHEIFSSMVPWVTNLFWKTFKTPRPPSYILNVGYLTSSKYDLSINFFIQKKVCSSYVEKIQNKNFSVFSKHGIPC